jgi:KDO transferase-3
LPFRKAFFTVLGQRTFLDIRLYVNSYKASRLDLTLSQQPSVLRDYKNHFLQKLYKLRHSRRWTHNAHLWPHIKIQRDADGVIRRFKVAGIDAPLTPFEQMFRHTIPSHIILSGPSVREIDYSLLDLGGVMGVNGAFCLKQQYPHLDFTHYCIIDEHFVVDRRVIVAEILRQDLGLFVTPSVLLAILQNFSLSDIRCRICLIEKVTEKALLPEPSLAELKLRQSPQLCVFDSPRKLGFSFDPNLGLFDADTVAYSAMQLLAAAGAQAIYFHGLDLSASGPRFYETPGDVCVSRLTKNYHRYIEPSFCQASELCRKKGIQLYNLSMVSVLPEWIIPKLNWRQLLPPLAMPASQAGWEVDPDLAGVAEGAVRLVA